MMISWSHSLLLALLVTSGACKKVTSGDSAAGSAGLAGAAGLGGAAGSAGSAGSAAVAIGSGAAGAAGSATVAPICDLAGSYRFRFRSNGQDGWWFRFKVDGAPAKATLVESVGVLALAPGPLDVILDPAVCKLTLTTKGKAVGELSIPLVLDPKTNAVTGQLVRTLAVDKDTTVPVVGVRDAGDPKPAAACLVPGIYKLEWTGATWKNADATDDRSCKEQSPLSTYLKVEPYGATVAISERESTTPYAESSGTDSVTRIDDCNVIFKLQNSMLELEAKLAFAADKLTGTATATKFQVVEDGEAGENIWDCEGKNVAVTATRVP